MKINKSKKYPILNKESGFTLIELMVAISIFMMIMTMAMGSLLVTLDAKKKAEALSFTMDNLNFAMESMTRNLRMGIGYDCQGGGGHYNCPNGNTEVEFIPAKNISGQKNVSSPYSRYIIVDKTIKRCTSSAPNTCVSIMAENIKINDDSYFYVKGVGKENPGPQIQPSIYIKISGFVTVKNDTIPFDIQTMVSQRTLELY